MLIREYIIETFNTIHGSHEQRGVIPHVGENVYAIDYDGETMQGVITEKKQHHSRGYYFVVSDGEKEVIVQAGAIFKAPPPFISSDGQNFLKSW
jgi:hypothetical protein